MSTVFTVSAIALAGAALLYGLGYLLAWSLLRAFAWRSRLRLAVVLFLWCVTSMLLVLPLFAMLLFVPWVLVETGDNWLFFTWVVGCFGASTVPFALAVAHRMEQISSAGKSALAA